MSKSIRLLPVVIALALGMPAAQAFTLSVVPQSATTPVGSSFSVDVVASGLGAGSAPSLGGYDLDVSFDASVLSFANVAWGTGLDVHGSGLNIQLPDSSTAGLVNLFEVSFDSGSDLDLLQGDAFTLFTVTFNANAPGTSALTLSQRGPLSDAAGNALTADFNNASVTVAPVPLPAAAWLFASGLAGAMGFARRRSA